MVHLHSVRLRGFKTFARQTELTFEPGITVIIGPNGSGKSNIADAVLWVLGEQSPANLRGRSMQDVVHTGPDGRKSSAVTEVSLVFDNDDASLPLERNQVEVTRRLVRDGGGSEYRLNGVVSRLFDVQDLVGGLGLGREMHSVISQGKVEALLSSTPEARRALVEEAAGLGRFKKRRERARSKLDKTRQNLLRVGDVEREVKSNLRPLRQQVAAAERFAQVTEEWALARAKLLLLELSEIESAHREIEGLLSSVSGRRTEIEGGLASLRKRRAEEEDQFTAALRDREELGVSYARIRTEAERLDARAVALRQRVARNEGELDRTRRRFDIAEAEVASLTAQLNELEAATTDESRLQRVTAIAASLQAALEASLPEYRVAVEREDCLKDAVFELEASRSRALQDRDFLRREVGEKRRLVRELNDLSRAASARLEGLRNEASELDLRLLGREDAVVQADIAVRAAAEDCEQAQIKAQKASYEETQLTEHLAGIELRQAVLRDLLERREGATEGARNLMETVQGSRLLTEVLRVEPGYERALAAALGPIVHAVVVSEAADIGLALQGSGPLEVIWERGLPRGLPQGVAPGPLPPGSRNLWEVVSGPAAVIGALQGLVGPTAVLPSGDVIFEEVVSAPEWAGWRLITCTGEVVTGGLHAARRTEASAETLLRARNELSSVAREHDSLLSRREEVRLFASEAARSAQEAEAVHRRAEEALREAERELAASRNEVDLHTRRMEEVSAQVEEMEERLGKENARADEMDAELRQVEARIAAIENELETARGSLRTQQGLLESMRRNVARLEDKKAQAALLEVKLRGRCRAHEAGREHIRLQRMRAAADAARYGRRISLLAEYAPVVAALRSIVEQLAEQSYEIARSVETRVDEVRQRAEEATKIIRDWGGEESRLQREHDEVAARIAQLQVDEARLAQRRAILEDDLTELRRKHMSPRAVQHSDVVGEDRDALVAAVQRAEQRRERIGPVNPLAEQECAEMEERARFLSEQRHDLEASLVQLQNVIAEIDNHVNSAFGKIFEATRENFAAVIATIFPGAKGTLTLTEGKPLIREDPGEDAVAGEPVDGNLTPDISGGISLNVKFANKAPRSMSLLSGGEKAMTAIAFLFSLFLARPCPFYILDEVEASLDDVNIRRFLSLVRKYREKTQFIIITHQRQTMEIADTLYGIALESDGTSRVLSRKFGDRRGSGSGQQQHPAKLVAKEA